jgi:hypothetical protein
MKILFRFVDVNKMYLYIQIIEIDGPAFFVAKATDLRGTSLRRSRTDDEVRAHESR